MQRKWTSREHVVVWYSREKWSQRKNLLCGEENDLVENWKEVGVFYIFAFIDNHHIGDG